MRAAQPVDVGFRDRHRLVGSSSASSVTIAVISLVSEAIGNFDSMFLAEENLAGLLVDDQRGLRFQRRLAQLARAHRGRDDRQCNQGIAMKPHPPSLLLVWAGQFSPDKINLQRK